MSQRQVITDLLGIQGWEVAPKGIEIQGHQVFIRIRRKPGTGFVCGGCGQRYLFSYDMTGNRIVRDFPVWGRLSFLEFKEGRVNCDRCGVHVERLDWLAPFQRQTIRYEKYIAALCDILPALDVADLECLDKNTIYRIDKKWLRLREEQRKMRVVRYLGIDEISIKKRHKYATVFYDLERREVIGIVKGRKQRNVSGFFRRWGKKMCSEVVAVCMDLWTPFMNSVRIHLKKAVVVFDKFHVFSYLSNAIDETRRKEQNKANAEGKELIKGSRWLWLKKKVRGKKKQTLEQIMTLNENLAKAYLLKEDFENFYSCKDKMAAEEFLNEWIERCNESKLSSFKKLAKRLKRWSTGILAYFEHRITNGISEGINNKIKVLKRRSYGFHDYQYFFLKILNITGALPDLNELEPHY